MKKEICLNVYNSDNATGEIVATVENLQDGDFLYLGGSELHFYPEKGI